MTDAHQSRTSNMSPLGVDETSVLLNVSVFSQNKFRKKAALQWHKKHHKTNCSCTLARSCTMQEDRKERKKEKKDEIKFKELN